MVRENGLVNKLSNKSFSLTVRFGASDLSLYKKTKTKVKFLFVPCKLWLLAMYSQTVRMV